MKRTMALLLMVCLMASLASLALAEDLLAKVGDCEYRLVDFAPSTYDYQDEPMEGLTGYRLIVEIVKEPDAPFTYHPNLTYDGGEVGARLRVVNIGVKATMGFDPANLYQTEGISVSAGGRIEYEYLVPEDKEPLQIVFYDQAQAQAAVFEVADIPTGTEE